LASVFRVEQVLLNPETYHRPKDHPLFFHRHVEDGEMVAMKKASNLPASSFCANRFICAKLKFASVKAPEYR